VLRKLAIRIIFCLWVFMVSATELSAKPWRGIEPLRSTRADVIRLFNQCLDQKEACEFTVQKETVYILFSGGLVGDHLECAKWLPPETVIFIEIEPLAALKFADFKLNKRRFKRFNPTAPYKFGFSGYLDESEGLVIKAYKGKVIQLNYISSATNLHLCPRYYDNPHSFIKVYEGHVPIVSLTCPKSPVPEGKQISLSAFSDFETKRGFLWGADTGAKFSWEAKQGIVAGQNTKTITIDTTGMGGQTLTVRAEVRAGLGLWAVDECKLKVLPRQL